MFLIFNFVLSLLTTQFLYQAFSNGFQIQPNGRQFEILATIYRISPLKLRRGFLQIIENIISIYRRLRYFQQLVQKGEG